MINIDTDILWPVVGAIAAGGLIGFEREYRGAPAGFRTHTLVALSSGLLMLAAVHQIRWLSDTPVEMIRIDPVRMAHGVLTGIGFLGAGVIFREGFTIRGLTTAASLWITASLGILFGVGFYGLAVGGTIATLVVLAAVSLTEVALPQRTYVDVAVRYRRAAGVSEGRFRAALSSRGLKLGVVSSQVDAELTTFSSTFQTYGRPDTEGLAQALCADPDVAGFEIRPRVQ